MYKLSTEGGPACPGCACLLSTHAPPDVSSKRPLEWDIDKSAGEVPPPRTKFACCATLGDALEPDRIVVHGGRAEDGHMLGDTLSYVIGANGRAQQPRIPALTARAQVRAVPVACGCWSRRMETPRRGGQPTS